MYLSLGRREGAAFNAKLGKPLKKIDLLTSPVKIGITDCCDQKSRQVNIGSVWHNEIGHILNIDTY